MLRISSISVDGLAHAGAAEQADLAALGDGHDQVDDLDARLEHSLLAACSSKDGGLRWIGMRLLGADGAGSSMGRPARP
jgi:hypothetical protein